METRPLATIHKTADLRGGFGTGSTRVACSDVTLSSAQMTRGKRELLLQQPGGQRPSPPHHCPRREETAAELEADPHVPPLASALHLLVGVELVPPRKTRERNLTFLPLGETALAIAPRTSVHIFEGKAREAASGP